MASEVPTQTAPDHSPNESISAEGGAHVNVNRLNLVVPMSVWFVALISVAAILMSIWALYQLGQVRVYGQLNALHLSEYQDSTGAWLVSQTKTNQALIEAYGIGKSCKAEKK